MALKIIDSPEPVGQLAPYCEGNTDVLEPESDPEQELLQNKRRETRMTKGVSQWLVNM